ncbi:ABC transporter ATP-binding protein [bacterium]|nr:MAG: ABC transporter ATP-binding protein [bacterium]
MSVSGLSVSYGQIRAIRDVSLNVFSGEIVAILGANGAGKSTLMKAVAGLVPPAAGNVEIEGRSVSRLPAHQRPGMGVALVPEGRKLFTPLTVEQNLRLGAYSLGQSASRKLVGERMDEVLETFPVLADRLHALAGELSGGQQQMLAIGRALMSKPRLLLLDEPSLGLAPRIVEDVFATLLALNESRDLSVLIAEQNIREALAVADRAYVIQLGKVVIEDDADILFDRKDIEDVYMGRYKDGADREVACDDR